MRILGIDPGTVNMASVVLNNGKCCYASMFESPIKDLRDTDQHNRFFNELNNLIKKQKPDEIIVERFALRAFGTALVEAVSVLVGGILSTAHHKRIYCDTTLAVTWKSNLKKFYDLDKLYEKGRETCLPPHIIDAMLMAFYLYKEKDFSSFSLKWFNTNIKIASKLLDDKYKIKPKRIAKKNAKLPAKQTKGKKSM